MADSDLPLSLDGLLALLVRLGGAEEAEVVRFALRAGVPREQVLEEVRREVERRTRALTLGE
jgi:hypothetical protein